MATAQWIKTTLKLSFLLFITGTLFLLFQKTSFAETTQYRSANTVTTDGNPQYINTSNCSVTDDNTCDRPQTPSSYANLYFRDFGDFGIPDGSTITNIKIRVTGKSNVAIYAGISPVDVTPGVIFASNCQIPSDLWRMVALVSANISTYTAITPVTNGTLASCLSLENIRTNKFIWRINYSGPQNWYANIDNFEIAFDYTPPAVPTPTPTPLPIQPFLDLPWDYQSQGFDFNEVAFNPGSWFDHEYPLQNFCCNPPVMNYTGEVKNDFYRSHSGYDFNMQNGIVLNTPVLAAASGWATFTPESQAGSSGNTIKIDHENDYQTWYEHLSSNDLVISSTNGRTFVNKGQKIGEVGMTGNTSGPHIHLSVLKDSNGNGNFDDDYPWGLTDPLGWEGIGIDPWTLWESYNRKGTVSHNLFIARTPPKQEEISTTGGLVSLGTILIDILNNTFNQAVQITADYGPFESAGSITKSVMPSVFLEAFDSFGDKITEFLQPVTLTYDYTAADLLNINEDSLKIYWYNEELNQWAPLPSNIDTVNKKVSAQITHFSQFALMGEAKDITAPTTDIVVSGDKGEGDLYRSDVSVSLQGSDNEGGIGLLYTLYTINGSDWFKYTYPIIFTSEGAHTITYQSFDKADNKEERTTIEFSIDKTPPEAEIKYNPDTLDVDIIGDDSSSSVVVNILDLPKNKNSINITDQAGNILKIIGKDKEKGRSTNITIESLQYNQESLISIDPTKLLVSFDLNNKSSDLRRLEQEFEVKGEFKIKLIYSAKTDKTKVITKVKGQEKVKEELPGIRILQLTTKNGTLNYTY